MPLSLVSRSCAPSTSMTRGRARNCRGSWKKSASTSCLSFVSRRFNSWDFVGFSLGFLGGVAKETPLLLLVVTSFLMVLSFMMNVFQFDDPLELLLFVKIFYRKNWYELYERRRLKRYNVHCNAKDFIAFAMINSDMHSIKHK